MQAVPAHHRDRVRAAGLGELDAAVRFVHEEALLGEPPDAVGDGGRPHAHPLRELLDGDRGRPTIRSPTRSP